ncbi:hypothetical protein PV327_008417 [Microctonus hyperodae]|nr:hypothetical protein PV327_008417 [Microctonus hyperodae]
MNSRARLTAREKFTFYNSLAILLKAVVGHKTTIDLRNESFVYGTIEDADACMNVVINDCIFTDPRGDKFRFDTFFVQARNIRSVHIPPNIPIIPAIRNELNLLMGPQRPIKSQKPTFKSKRAQKKQEEDKAAMEKLLSMKNIEEPSCSYNK